MTVPLRSVQAPHVSLSDAIDGYLATLSHPESAGTRTQYASALGRLLDGLGRHRDVADITQAELADWMAARYSACKPKTWNRMRNVIRAAWNHFADEGLVRRDDDRWPPSWPVKARREPDPVPKAIPGKVMAMLMLDESVPARERALWWLLYGTGARASEILRLDVETVDQVSQRASVVRKGSRPGEVGWGDMAAGMLAAYLDGRATGPLFTSRNGRLSLRRAEEILTERTRSLPGGPYRLHQFRHTQMTEMGEAGASTALIEARGGWAPGSKIASVYTRPGIGALQKWARRQGPPEWMIDS